MDAGTAVHDRWSNDRAGPTETSVSAETDRQRDDRPRPMEQRPDRRDPDDGANPATAAEVAGAENRIGSCARTGAEGTGARKARR